MSRCFPFPPPGYEKKPSNDHLDLIAKACGIFRQGELTLDLHLQWVRGWIPMWHVLTDFIVTPRFGPCINVYKEGVEFDSQNNKKEVAPSPKNCRKKTRRKKNKKKEKKEKEKREGKEKKDKDKHKEKDRSKDNHREKKDRKDKHKGKKRKKDKEKQKILNDQAADGSGAEKITKHGLAADIHGDPSFKEVLVERIKDDANGAVTQMGKETNSGFQILHGMHIPADKNRNQGSELVCITNVPEKKKNFTEGSVASGMASAMPQSTEQRRVDEGGFSAVNHAKERVETSEKTEESKIDDEKRERNKDNDRQKRHKWKYEDRDKEKKKEKRRKGEERKHVEQERLVGMEQIDRVELHSGASATAVNKKTGAETTLKRKERNGFLHEEEMWPMKLSRPASSPRFQAENGKKSHANHIAAPSASERHEVVNSTVETAPDNKEQGIDGMINIQPLSKPRPPPVPGAVGNGDSVKRLPHPDEKYLSEILRLPRVDESPGFDDQGWLFSTDDSCQTQPRTRLEASGEVPQPQVWDRGLHIDSADVFALPYVVPY